MRKKKPKQLVKTNLDIFPVRSYDEDMKAFVLEDGSYLDIFERMADDVDNMLEDEVQYEMLHFARFLKTYEEDIKLLSMNFPTDTIEQQKAILERAESTNSPVKKKWLMRSLDELRRVEAGDYVRCFDISGEFTKLTKEFGGKIIRCDGSSGILNPLEILRSGDDERTSFIRHISKVCAFYQCMTEAETEELIALSNLLHKFYESLNLLPGEGRRITGLAAGRSHKRSHKRNIMLDN